MIEPIRVLQINYGMDRGGAETLIMNIYRNIDRDKVQFDFLLHDRNKTAYEDEILSLGGRIYHIPRYLGYNKFSYEKELGNFLKEHPEYMIIHDHLMNSAKETFRIAKKFGRITVAHSHIAGEGSTPSDALRFFFRCGLWKVSDYRFACSKEAGEWLYRGKADFKVLNNGIDTEKFKFNENERRKTRMELGIDENTILVSNIGRMVRQKNQARILDIFALFHKRNPNSKLMIVGKGPLRESLIKKAEELSLEKCIILPGEREDIPSLLSSSDIFLFPSLFEGLGIALVEAEASGLVSVLSSHLPKEVDLIPPLMHRVSLKDDDSKWVEEMEKALSEKIERDRCYTTIKDKGYDIKSTAEKMENFYLSISKETE